MFFFVVVRLLQQRQGFYFAMSLSSFRARTLTLL